MEVEETLVDRVNVKQLLWYGHYMTGPLIQEGKKDGQELNGKTE